MKISTKTRYCLQFLAETARFYGIRTVSLKEIARNQNLPLKYLSYSVIPLKTAGIITAVRGNTGGYTLTRAPGNITLREIYEALEGEVKALNSSDGRSDCKQETDSPTRWVWQGLAEAMAEYMEGLSLEDIRKKLTPLETIDYYI